MTMEITTDRLEEINILLSLWLDKEKASIKEIQSLLGKHNFIGSCVKSSRVFVSRLLNLLRDLHGSPSNMIFDIPQEFKKDILWWSTFLPLYNGVSLISLGSWSEPDAIFSSDSCLESCGGFWKGNFFHSVFPSFILGKQLHIGALEMLSLVVCVHLWGNNFKHKRILVLCDNLSVCITLKTGKSRCPFLQSCLREICYFAAINEFEIKAQHLPSEHNRIADHLSRWGLNPIHEQQFKMLTKEYEYIVYMFSENHLEVLRLDLKKSNKRAYAVGSRRNLRVQWESFILFCLFF
jgi:hypothetical protein